MLTRADVSGNRNTFMDVAHITFAGEGSCQYIQINITADKCQAIHSLHHTHHWDLN